MGLSRGIPAAIFSFMAGVMAPCLTTSAAFPTEVPSS